jgi:acyl-CoA thioesterase-2
MQAESLRDALALEQLEENLYRGPRTRSRFLFGGLVAAQALRAAAWTVPGERRPNSLHGYFLRRGSAERPIVYQVDRDRDGRSFSSRRVVAIQGGEVLLNAAMSFQVPTEAPTLASPIPDDRPAEAMPIRKDLFVGPREFFEVRSDFEAGAPDRFWVRSRSPVGPDATLQACALAYVTDLSSGFGRPEHAHLGWARSSLDHAIWFHEGVSVDDWLLVDMRPIRASHQRGTYHGTVHAEDRRMGCTFAQEIMLLDRSLAPERLRNPGGRDTKGAPE